MNFPFIFILRFRRCLQQCILPIWMNWHHYIIHMSHFISFHLSSFVKNFQFTDLIGFAQIFGTKIYNRPRTAIHPRNPWNVKIKVEFVSYMCCVQSTAFIFHLHLSRHANHNKFQRSEKMWILTITRFFSFPHCSIISCMCKCTNLYDYVTYWMFVCKTSHQFSWPCDLIIISCSNLAVSCTNWSVFHPNPSIVVYLCLWSNFFLLCLSKGRDN